MEQLWINLPALAPDYSGVCSAMFDLQGISVIQTHLDVQEIIQVMMSLDGMEHHQRYSVQD